MMTEIDDCLRKVLKNIYSAIEKAGGKVSVSSPEYKQIQVDELIRRGLLKKIDISTFDGWEYVLSPTYEGEKEISETVNPLRIKVDGLIKKGIEIGNSESHISQGPYNITTVSGPMYDEWMGEINIFNERHLKDHPLYNSIYTTYVHRKNNTSSYNDMMGHLRALSADEEFLGYIKNADKGEVIMKNDSITKMIAKDIERCKHFLENPKDEATGKELYIDLTSRYDSIIPSFGSGLYQYYAEQDFYDPEISGEALIINIRKLMNKMLSYYAMNCTETIEMVLPREQIGNKDLITKSNKVFIVHGHDNEAKQEMARTLEKFGLEAIILHEQADSGLTIIEKIEKYSDVDFAVVLYTECDLGRVKEEDVSSEKYRARQNVVFEHGYLIGKLGRGNVCAIVKGAVETPGDISGVVYTPMDADGAWKMRLAKNMKNAGINIDLNRLCK